MNIIKVTTINEDGSVNFEGFFGPNEVQLILEVGTNLLLQQGVMGVVDDGEDEEEFVIESHNENPTNRH